MTAKAPESIAERQVGTFAPPLPEKDLVYRFKISRRANPIEFRNLWELAFKGPQDKDYAVVIDADMLSTVISRINYIFEADGL
jgi:hypothetical protein